MGDRLVDLMREIGGKGLSIHVRYDALREQLNFTVIVGGWRLGDCDDPAELVERNYSKIAQCADCWLTEHCYERITRGFPKDRSCFLSKELFDV